MGAKESVDTSHSQRLKGYSKLLLFIVFEETNVIAMFSILVTTILGVLIGYSSESDGGASLHEYTSV